LDIINPHIHHNNTGNNHIHHEATHTVHHNHATIHFILDFHVVDFNVFSKFHNTLTTCSSCVNSSTDFHNNSAVFSNALGLFNKLAENLSILKNSSEANCHINLISQVSSTASFKLFTKSCQNKLFTSHSL
jgi:hypothetical protein